MSAKQLFPYEEIRSLLFEYLAKQPSGNFSSAVEGVISLAKKHGLYAGSDGHFRRIGGPSYDLGQQDHRTVPEKIRQMFWQLLVQGILVFGSDDLNPNWPWFRVTEFGQQALGNQGARPYDPEGFLKEFAAKNPEADDVILDYLNEAVRTFNTGCYKAASVMLGCASERLILLLHETFENAFEDKAKQRAFAKTYRWTVSSKFDSLRCGLDAMIDRKKLPSDLAEAVRSDLVGVFELIRRIRNSAGHPNLPLDMRRETIYLSLAIFPEYARQVLRLIGHFRTHPAEP
jgi:hypothetical protein